MPVYSFQLSAFLAGKPVTVRDAAGDVVTSGTLDSDAGFSAELAVGDYVASATDGRYTYRSAGTVEQGDPDRLAGVDLSDVLTVTEANSTYETPSGAQAKADAAVSTRVTKGSLAHNVKDYGAAGDGVTNDTPAVQAAIDAAAVTTGSVFLPAGRYRVAGLTLPAGVTLRGAGAGATTLVQSGTPSFMVQSVGSLAAGVALTANAVLGAVSLAVASTSGLAAGDVLVLGDTVSYDPTDASCKSGEMVVVKSVDSATQVSLTGPVAGSLGSSDRSYTTANGATIRKASLVKGAGVADLSFEGDRATTTGILLAQLTDGFRVTNVTVNGGGGVGINLHSSRDATVTGVVVRDLTDNLAGGQLGYGVVLSGPCDGITVTGCSFARMRHAFTTTGNGTGLPHRVVVSGCTAADCTTAAFDTHAAGDGILIEGCQVTGGAQGIQVRSPRTTVRGCVVRRATGTSIQVVETVAKDVVLDGNLVADTASGQRGIVTAAVDGLVITRNRLFRIGADGIRIDVGSKRVEITDNVVRNYGLGVAGRSGIQSAAGGTAQSGWLIARNTVGCDTGVGSASSAISCGGSLTGSWVVDNRAHGTFSATVFDTVTNTSRRNERLDQAPTSVTGSRGGNAALGSLLTQLAAQGLVTDSTSA